MRPNVTINKLLRLAELLRDVHAERPRMFRMDSWVGWKNTRIIRDPPEGIRECNTTACIGGWATTIEKSLEFSPRYGSILLKGYPDVTGKEAFAEAYGITGDEAHDLCHRGMSRNALQAARLVENLAEKYAKRHGYDIVEA